MEACLDSLIDVKPGSDRVGPLVLLGLGDGSRQSMKQKLSPSLPIQVSCCQTIYTCLSSSYFHQSGFIL